MNDRGFVVAIVGAESTGKSTLASGLAEALRGPLRRVAVVDEALREFCDTHGRTPARDEQAGIAAEQTRRIDVAAAHHDLVVADTTALMTAVYSDIVFGDTGLYEDARRWHARSNLTLLTALDLAWQPDGLQRDGPHVREPVDERIRAALARGGCNFSVVAGSGSARLDAALACVERALAPTPEPPAARARWQWHCERCGDAHCERHALQRFG